MRAGHREGAPQVQGATVLCSLLQATLQEKGLPPMRKGRPAACRFSRSGMRILRAARPLRPMRQGGASAGNDDAVRSCLQQLRSVLPQSRAMRYVRRTLVPSLPLSCCGDRNTDMSQVRGPVSERLMSSMRPKQEALRRSRRTASMPSMSGERRNIMRDMRQEHACGLRNEMPGMFFQGGSETPRSFQQGCFPYRADGVSLR